MNSERETKGDPLQAPTPPESLMPAHASPAVINGKQKGPSYFSDLATAEAIWANLSGVLGDAPPRKTIDSHRNAHHRSWRETGFCGGHYVDYEGRAS